MDELGATFAAARDIGRTANAGVALLTTAGLADAALLAVARPDAASGDGHEMWPVAASGYPELPSEPTALPASVEPDTAAARREVLETDPWLQPLRGNVGDRAWVARVPLARGEETLGLLILVARRRSALRDLDLLQTVGALFASALDHARLYEAAFERQRELEEQDTRRREFLYAIAHELRTPLTSIQAFADLLAERRRTAQGQDPDLVDSLTRGVGRLGTLVDDLLELGRLDQGPVRVELAPVDVGESLRAAEAILRPAFMQREQSMSMELPDGPIMAVADSRSLEQVLLNLLSNANRHTPARGSVGVRVTGDDDVVRIDVEDSGPGIDALDRTRIFEPFYRVQRPGAATVPGSGLGLAVARRFTQLQGGRIWVEDADGGGARFCVELSAVVETEVAAGQVEPRMGAVADA